MHFEVPGKKAQSVLEQQTWSKVSNKSMLFYLEVCHYVTDLVENIWAPSIA